MMRNFTRKLFTSCLAILATTFTVFGQLVNTVTITAPASIAGTYTINLASYGQQLESTLTGTGTFINDGTAPETDACDDGGANVFGKIAFIDRGICQFQTKSWNAEEQDAIAAIICNNEPGAGIMAVGPGDMGLMPTLPTLGMSYEDCQTIRVVAETEDVDITISYICNPPTYGSEVIWGQNSGEGDFAGGLSGWTVECAADTCWAWNAEGFADGAFTNDFIASPTACNGAMVFASDLLDNGGDYANGANEGTGPCPAPCTGSITSPTIDLLQFTDIQSLFVRFHQRFRYFANVTSNLLLSTNGGITFPDTVALNANYVVNAPSIDEELTVPLPLSYKDATQLTMRFEHTGNYYFWTIDDVRLVNLAPFVDAQGNSNWYGAPPVYNVPKDHPAAFPFIIDIFNNGNETADPLTVTVDIQDEAGESIYSQTNMYDPLAGQEINMNMVFPEIWETPTEEGRYSGSYTVGAPGDIDSTNNSLDFWFNVTENYFGNVPSEQEASDLSLFAFEPMTDGSIFAEGGNQFALNYAVGNVYSLGEVAANETVTKVVWGLTDEETVASGFVYIRLYALPNGDENTDFSIQATERILVGGNNILIDAIQNGRRMIESEIWKTDSNGEIQTGVDIELQSNTSYLLVFITKPLLQDQIDLLSYPASSTVSINGRNFYRFPTVNAFTDVGSSITTGTFFEPTNDGTVEDFSSIALGFYSINELYSEMHLGTKTDVNEVNESISFKSFPNPATEFVNVNLGLEIPSDIQIQVTDITGKLVLTQKQANFQNGTILVDVAHLANGTYTVKVVTQEGFKTETLVIQK